MLNVFFKLKVEPFQEKQLKSSTILIPLIINYNIFNRGWKDDYYFDKGQLIKLKEGKLSNSKLETEVGVNRKTIHLIWNKHLLLCRMIK